jgi:hypothetical protein
MEITYTGDFKDNVSLVFLCINPTIQGWTLERLEAPVRDTKE